MLDTGDNPDAPAPREMIDLEVNFVKWAGSLASCWGELILKKFILSNSCYYDYYNVNVGQNN